jgi:hypothetical protein
LVISLTNHVRISSMSVEKKITIFPSLTPDLDLCVEVQ